MCALFDPPEPRRVAPGEYPVWDRALALLNQDLTATLPALEPLQLLALPFDDADEPEYIHVATANGEWHGSSLEPHSQHSLASALANVADAAQETVVELLWQAWPLCPEHGLGMHPREDAEKRLSWWCAGERLRQGSAHIHAAVGALDASGTSLSTGP
ncbi:hypothetical protein SAMN06272735_4490 [Streptomyces sp. TLI_55]|uniref:hypothetical protein n=1 Tax=Streptomyces sp. TLI_55 TaxID=1938861 RepID=UPI000BDBCF80|nr:hypothetical protein [Streptomyces sp. TLI_55]SNX62703.1 hypothetical protein SAMN06272735_4490 [Streptomyces sp. TLI_55]